jgi:hypothetical protein
MLAQRSELRFMLHLEQTAWVSAVILAAPDSMSEWAMRKPQLSQK